MFPEKRASVRRSGAPSPPILLCICILCIFSSPVSAEATLSFDDLTLVANQGIELYRITETGSELIGVYNSSSTGISLSEGASYVAVLRPSKTERWSDPATLANDLVTWAGDHAFGIGVLAILALVLLGSRRRGGS